ncbi:MAG TPA: hypothetical protein VLJ61_17355 [Pyrinomonadaceae bacterium]|nr:hypothetical protein [Pyrinomonadaceae bacterium]
MPVIGRLDEQVEDVLISPVSKRRREDDQQPGRDEEPTARRDDAPTQTPSKNESSANAGELPVWLL